jgi:hypothetical protein
MRKLCAQGIPMKALGSRVESRREKRGKGREWKTSTVVVQHPNVEDSFESRDRGKTQRKTQKRK